MNGFIEPVLWKLLCPEQVIGALYNKPMLENLRPLSPNQEHSEEPLVAKKATFSDRLISWMVDSWQKKKPDKDSFSRKQNTVFRETYTDTSTSGLGEGFVQNEMSVPEKDLPVVQEALSLFQEHRDEGRVIGKERNPLGEGEKVRDLTLMIFGDAHIPGSDRAESPYELNEKPYRIFKKIRLLFLGIKEKWDKAVGKTSSRMLWSVGNPQEQNFTSGKEEPETADFASFEEKTDTLDDVDNFLAFQALKTAFTQSVHEIPFSNDSQTLVVNVGDNGDGYHSMGDLALAALNLDQVRSEVSQGTGVPTVMTHLAGNHDSDLANHDLEHDQFHRDLFGEQIFLQEVGKDCILLAVNTNFYSTFWHEHLQRRKHNLTPENRLILENIWKEMRKQKALVEEAIHSGKKIILLGHERGYLEQALGVSWSESPVVAVISGHTHKHERFEGKNKNGEAIQFLNVGATQKIGVNGETKRVLSGFSLRVKDSDENLSLEIQDIIPNEQQYREAEQQMSGG